MSRQGNKELPQTEIKTDRQIDKAIDIVTERQVDRQTIQVKYFS